MAKRVLTDAQVEEATHLYELGLGMMAVWRFIRADVLPSSLHRRIRINQLKRSQALIHEARNHRDADLSPVLYRVARLTPGRYCGYVQGWR